MAESTFSFEILTPEHSFFSGEIEALTFTSTDGEWTVLKLSLIHISQPTRP